MGLLFFLYPFVEIFLLFRLIQTVGFLNFLLSVLISALLGFLAISWGGRATLVTLQKNFGQSEVPSDKIAHRGLVVVGGILLILPGFLTDIVGVLFVLPGFRHLILTLFKGIIARGISKGTFKVFSFQNNNSHFERDAQVIEAEVLESSSKTID